MLAVSVDRIDGDFQIGMASSIESTTSFRGKRPVDRIDVALPLHSNTV